MNQEREARKWEFYDFPAVSEHMWAMTKLEIPYYVTYMERKLTDRGGEETISMSPAQYMWVVQEIVEPCDDCPEQE